ncbi:hypothetical protein AAULR_10035, partial [Lacticaseibacillus rhamnosus MTCC 5462]
TSFHLFRSTISGLNKRQVVGLGTLVQPGNLNNF